MPLETATYLSDLNPSNPAHTDQLNQDDAHMRLVKGALKATFPNFTATALQASQAELDAVAHTKQIAAQDGAPGAPSITFATDSTAGFRKGSRAGQTLIEGNLRGSGSVPCGALVDFPVEPPRFTKGGTAAGGQAAIDYLEQDGSTYNVTDYPDLAALLGLPYQVVAGVSFKVPNVKDTGRFRRSRTSTLTAGSYQTNALKSHAHTGTTLAAGGHTHTATVNDPGHTHSTTAFSPSNSTAAGPNPPGGASGATNTGSNTTGITVSISTVADHTHDFGTGATGDVETRPESFVVVSCIKT